MSMEESKAYLKNLHASPQPPVFITKKSTDASKAKKQKKTRKQKKKCIINDFAPAPKDKGTVKPFVEVEEAPERYVPTWDDMFSPNGVALCHECGQEPSTGYLEFDGQCLSCWGYQGAFNN